MDYMAFGTLIIACAGIWQTKRMSTINSNQFVFDRRLEIITIFRAISNLEQRLNFEDINDSENFFSDVMEWESRSENVFSIVKEEFAMVRNHALFYEGTTFSEAENVEDFEKKRIEYLLWKNTLNAKVASIEYLFSSEELKGEISNVMTKYVELLDNFVTLFYQINTVKDHNSIRVLLISHNQMVLIGNELKIMIEEIDLEKSEKIIKKELTVFWKPKFINKLFTCF